MIILLSGLLQPSQNRQVHVESKKHGLNLLLLLPCGAKQTTKFAIQLPPFAL